MARPYRKGWHWRRRTDWAEATVAGCRWSTKWQRFIWVAWLGRKRGWAYRWQGEGWKRDGYPNATAAMRAAERAVPG